MKKFTVILSVFMVFAFMVVPAFAQSERQASAIEIPNYDRPNSRVNQTKTVKIETLPPVQISNTETEPVPVTVINPEVFNARIPFQAKSYGSTTYGIFDIKDIDVPNNYLLVIETVTMSADLLMIRIFCISNCPLT